MSMLKVVEILAESDKSWEDAAQFAVDKAGKSVRNVKSIYIKNLEAQVVDGKISKYRINGKISFVLEEDKLG
jgi:flavin-binding protein dodecin